MQDVEKLAPADLLPHQQALLEKQRHYLMQKSDFYADLWKGRSPPTNLLDLPLLPLSCKSQLRLSQEQNPPFGSYLASDIDQVVRMHRTSGTTGQAMNLGLSTLDCEITETVGGRSHRAARLRPEHKVVHCLNYQM